MKNSISCIALLLISTIGFAQPFLRKDTLRFAPDSSYARAVQRFGKQLVFGTSRNGVIALNEKKQRTKVLITPSPDGEFRDVAVVGKTVYGMVSGDNGWLYATGNTVVAQNAGVFYDDLVLFGSTLYILGDPVDGIFFLRKIETTSIESANEALPAIPNKPNEACYAASGTTAIQNGRFYCFVSGGTDAARFHRFDPANTYRPVYTAMLPMVKGEGAGPFSVYFSDSLHGVCVGGNYLQPKDTSGTAVFTTDGGITWKHAHTAPGGYRSCVTGFGKVLFACGTTGIDFSTDGGIHWKPFDTGNFCALLAEKNTLYATTNKGTCIRYKLNSSFLR